MSDAIQSYLRLWKLTLYYSSPNTVQCKIGFIEICIYLRDDSEKAHLLWFIIPICAHGNGCIGSWGAMIEFPIQIDLKIDHVTLGNNQTSPTAYLCVWLTFISLNFHFLHRINWNFGTWNRHINPVKSIQFSTYTPFDRVWIGN